MSIVKISPAKAKKIMDSDVNYRIVDVREEEEYVVKHIAGATLVPLSMLEDEMDVEELLPDKEQTLLVYCRSGNRSATAAVMLEELGYDDIRDFGGLLDWPYATVTLTEEVMMAMIEFDKGDARRIAHFIKVYEYAKMIGLCEKLDKKTYEILKVAAILHDIGIRPSEEKYGDSIGKHQEELGPDYARRLLKAIPGVSDKMIDRVCFLIGHHHTYTDVDGIDYQIILEADYLVNSQENNLPVDAILKFRENVFKTPTGIRILNTQYGLE